MRIRDRVYGIAFWAMIPLWVVSLASFLFLIITLSLFSGVPIEDVPEWARWIIAFVK